MKFGQLLIRRSAKDASNVPLLAAFGSRLSSRLAIGSARPVSTAMRNAEALAKRYAVTTSISRVSA
ncbi:hypothetical protein BAY1663_00456 [Pseudomonas sp. BAY1663]|nr:hypothetical protein BAY1663_00456 [Pseudomonas sp. BAY1663]